MIFDKLTNADAYKGISQGIDTALEYLEKNSSRDFRPGVVKIDGDNIFAVSADYEAKPIKESKTEAHRKYIDVQYIVKGIETMYIAETDSMEVFEDYDDERDVVFFKEKSECSITASAGHFAVFFPWDAHMPGVLADGLNKYIEKVVVKVHV